MYTRFMLVDGEFIVPIYKVLMHRTNRLVIFDYLHFGQQVIDIAPYDTTIVNDPFTVEDVKKYYLFFDFPYMVMNMIFSPVNGVDEKRHRCFVKESEKYRYPFVIFNIGTIQDRYDVEIPLVNDHDYMGYIDAFMQELHQMGKEIDDLRVILHIPLLPEKGKLMMRNSLK